MVFGAKPAPVSTVSRPAAGNVAPSDDAQLVSNLVWAGGSRLVHDVWVGGEQVIDAGEPTRADRRASLAFDASATANDDAGRAILFDIPRETKEGRPPSRRPYG